MNIIAIDIGNTNITVALFVQDQEKSVEVVPGKDADKLASVLQSAWEEIPIAERSKQNKRNGVIVVSSVRPAWTKLVREIAKEKLGEKIHIIGKDVPLPMALWVEEPQKVGTDRVVSAAAAFAVVEDAVVIADFGTAVTIDLVDQNGVFQGGVIFPGFEISAGALKDNTAQLPMIEVTRPEEPFGKTTTAAINCGLYYSVIGALQEIVRRYAEKIGKWPHTVITGSAAKLIKDDCEFVDSYVPNLAVKGVILAYRKYLEQKE